MLIQMSSEMLHSSCQNLLFQEIKNQWDNKASNHQNQEAVLVEAAVAAEHQEVVVDLEVEQEEEAEEEEPQEEEEGAIDSIYLYS